MAATIVLMREELALIGEPGQTIQLVAPDSFCEWSLSRDNAFRIAVDRLYREGAISRQVRADMLFRKK